MDSTSRNVNRSTSNYFLKTHDDNKSFEFGPKTIELMKLHSDSPSVFWKIPEDTLHLRHSVANILLGMEPELFDAVCYNYLEFSRMIDFSGRIKRLTDISGRVIN
jgi:hypothetical protein